jgi:hypothetical protein
MRGGGLLARSRCFSWSTSSGIASGLVRPRAARLLLRDAATAWDEADGLTRRQWNGTFFDRLYVDAGGVQRADRSDFYQDPRRGSRERPRLDCREANPERFARGSTFHRVVETAGIEPASAIA